MIQINGYAWPNDVGEKYKHALAHVGSLEWSLAACARRRTAVQAGGNVGLWPKRMAEVFERVYTFEPDPISLDCLVRNVLSNVVVSNAALGASSGTCGLVHRSLGSHRVVEGDTVPMTTIDALGLTDVDLIQLDVEGYEWHALMGGLETIAKCHPLIQVELRGFTDKYGQTDSDVRSLLGDLGYREVAQRPGSDFVFRFKGAS